MSAIKINNLIKEYINGVRALDGLNLKVKKGEIFSLLGPNGAGKSSLISILTTYYKKTSGEVNILGKDLCKEPDWIRKQIACVAQSISIDEHLSLMENMIFQSRMYKINSQEAKKRIDYLIKSFDLSNYLNYPTSSYSGGVKRRLDIAMNIVSSPKILFLDEPTVGMDVQSRKALWKMLLKIKKDLGTTIFLTTHYLEEADEVSDNISIIKNGKEIIQGSPNSLRHCIRQNIIRIKFSDDRKARKYIKLINNINFIKFSKLRDKSLFVNVKDSKKSFNTLNKWLSDHDVEIEGIDIVEPSLEDVFLFLTNSKDNKEDNYA